MTDAAKLQHILIALERRHDSEDEVALFDILDEIESIITDGED